VAFIFTFFMFLVLLIMVHCPLSEILQLPWSKGEAARCKCTTTWKMSKEDNWTWSWCHWPTNTINPKSRQSLWAEGESQG
jgi:hypothetical protein